MATSDNPLHRRFCRTLLALHGLTWLASLAMPDVSRSVKMWRMFLPIYMKCKWTKLKYQKTNGYSWKVLQGTLSMTPKLRLIWSAGRTQLQPSSRRLMLRGKGGTNGRERKCMQCC